MDDHLLSVDLFGHYEDAANHEVACHLLIVIRDGHAACLINGERVLDSTDPHGVDLAVGMVRALAGLPDPPGEPSD